MTVSLVVGAVWWNQAEEQPSGPPAPASGPHAGAGASAGAGEGGSASPTARGGAATRPTPSGSSGARGGAVPPKPSASPRRAAGSSGPARPGGSVRPAAPARPSRSARPAESARPSAPSPTPLRPLSRSRATRLLIPYIGVDAPVMGLRLDRKGRLTAPPDDKPKLVGWYEAGPSPGEQGTAVVVGHLDTVSGPAVFAGLGELKRGKRVAFRRADGRTAVYTVDAVESYEKEGFPNDEVYGARGRPELRLITCGGSYRPRTGYSGNVVVFAHLTDVREPRTGARWR
ncbi:class F sortase [Streptomyces sp. NPDC006997]|uniref:class F sortase n=1 Tax=Streptomyces sp. NPDC006997 TaxID=3155356 RepID=UPI0034018812